MSEENETTLDDMLIEKEMGGAEQKVFLQFGMYNCKNSQLVAKSSGIDCSSELIEGILNLLKIF